MKKLFINIISFSFIVLSSFIIVKICLLRQYTNNNVEIIINDKKEKLELLDKQIMDYEKIINDSNEDVELWQKKIEIIQKY